MVVFLEIINCLYSSPAATLDAEPTGTGKRAGKKVDDNKQARVEKFEFDDRSIAGCDVNEMSEDDFFLMNPVGIAIN